MKFGAVLLSIARQSLPAGFAVSGIGIMPIQAATGADQSSLFPIGGHPGSKDPGCLEGYEYDSGDDHDHSDQLSHSRNRHNISEAYCRYCYHYEIKGISEVVHLGIERAFHEIEYAGIDKEEDDDAENQPGDIDLLPAYGSKEHMAP